MSPSSEPGAHRVVVGYIPTPEGEAAVDAAITEASLRDAALVLVNASRGGAAVDPMLADDAALASVRDRCARAGVELQVRRPTGHDPVADLLAAAAEPTTVALVVGLRRRSPVGKLLMGSTAQRLLLEAECPVVAVKAG